MASTDTSAVQGPD